MTINIETELKEILLEIKSDVKDLKKEVSDIKTDVVVLKTNQENIKEKLSTQQKAIDKIPDLAEKVGELKNWRQIAIIIITGTASTVFGWILKSGKF
jgi:chromosome segregation ATPase